MITFEEAYDMVMSHAFGLGSEDVRIEQATGRILRENLYADRDLPPYDRVTMDGIAVNYQGAQSTQSLVIEGIAAAGKPRQELKNITACIEVMTGCSMPKNADTVIRYEDLSIENGIATIQADYRQNQNIHYKGQDRSQGELLASKGKMISPAEIGVAASVGKKTLKVSRLPKAIIISTGDELVDISAQPEPHQIRKSNSYQIQSLLSTYGLNAETTHLNDDYEAIKKYLAQALQDYEIIILSGGVSMGKFDFIPKAMEELGVAKLFHKVKQRPGKPFWFGRHSSGTTIFALPGNPISSFMCSRVYLCAWLKKSLGYKNNIPKAILDQDVSFRPDLTYFLEVKISFADTGQLLATPCKGNGSGDLANLSNADGFIRLPRGREQFRKGEVCPIYTYRNIL